MLNFDTAAYRPAPSLGPASLSADLAIGGSGLQSMLIQLLLSLLIDLLSRAESAPQREPSGGHAGPDVGASPQVGGGAGQGGASGSGAPLAGLPVGAAAGLVGGPASLPAPNGVIEVNTPIVVRSGEVFNGGGRLFKAGAALGDGGQSESQKPIFIVEDGGAVKNLQLQGADGIHVHGSARIDDVWWRDVGEDALTMKAQGNVVVNGGGAFQASDKIFQLNAGGSFTLNNFQADTFGKAIRTNGGKDFDIRIDVNRSSFRNGEEAIVRTDAKRALVRLADVSWENVKNDVLAPIAGNVTGASRLGYKGFSG